MWVDGTTCSPSWLAVTYPSLAIFNLLKGSKKRLWLHVVTELSGMISHLS